MIKKNSSRSDLDNPNSTKKTMKPKNTQFYKLINDKFDDILKEVKEEEDISKNQMKMVKNFTRKRKMKASSLDHSIERSIKASEILLVTESRHNHQLVSSVLTYRQQSGSPEVQLRNENGNRQQTKFPDIKQRKDQSPQNKKSNNVKNSRYQTVKLKKSASIKNMKQSDSSQIIGTSLLLTFRSAKRSKWKSC